MGHAIVRGLYLALGWLALLYSAALAALALAWAIDSDATWWVAASNVLALVLFVPLPIMLALAALLRSRPLRAGAALMLALFVAQFSVQLMPPAAPPPGRALRVLSINVLGSNLNTIGVIAAIRAQGADIVALQELSGRMARTIDRSLSTLYPYRYLAPTPESYGLGLLSRYPLGEPRQIYNFAGQRAVVNIGGTSITLLNVHLPSPDIGVRWVAGVPVLSGYDTTMRSHSAPELLRTLDSISGPLIALGDFNTAEREPLYHELRARGQDAFRSTSWGFGASYPNWSRWATGRPGIPLVRIDYVWTRGGVAPAAAAIDCTPIGSDHCMMIADLRIG